MSRSASARSLSHSSRSTSYVDYDFCDGVDLVFINLDDDFFFNDESLDFM